MKKIMKNKRLIILGFLLGLIVAGSVVYATVQFQASEVGYKGTTVDRALDTLYEKANARTVVCALVEGQGKTVGSKYYCNPGDNVYRAFYVLKVNTDDVELIMEKNLSDTIGENATMTWQDAVDFFNEGHPGYETKQSWNNVISVDLPGAQEIADAGGIANWNLNTATTWSYFGVNSQSDTSKRINYRWLYNYTRNCIYDGNCSYEYNGNDTNHAYGYWYKDLNQSDENRGWHTGSYGTIANDPISNNLDNGVRPVIKVAKSSLSS